jgi:hypothetical protein
MTFLLLLAFWYTLKILKKGDWSSYLSAGFACGLAIVTKFPAVVFCATIALAHFFITPVRKFRQHWKILVSAGSCVLAAFIGCPFLFLDFRSALADVSHEARTEHLGHSGQGLLQNLFWYIKQPLPDAVSSAGFALAIIGIALLMFSRRKDGWLLLSFPLLFVLFISNLGLRWERWILPVVPFLSVIVSFAFVKLITFVVRRVNQRVAVICATVILVATIGPLLKRTVGAVVATTNPHTVTLSREWLLNHAPHGSRILIETYGPQLPADLFTIIVVEERGNLAEAKSPYKNRLPGWRIAEMENLDDLMNQQIEFVVMSGNYEELLHEKEKYSAQLAKYNELMKRGALVFDSNEIPISTRGPRIRIFRVNRQSNASS